MNLTVTIKVSVIPGEMPHKQCMIILWAPSACVEVAEARIKGISVLRKGDDLDI